MVSQRGWFEVCSGGGARKAVVWQQLRGLGFGSLEVLRDDELQVPHRIASHRMALPCLHGSPWLMDHEPRPWGAFAHLGFAYPVFPTNNFSLSLSLPLSEDDSMVGFRLSS
ncbi:hypothetical protein KC19_1G004200 [Ceratodon purpureus]|uniref:Uncharacterized protein n=1 Tax=Ceratodon purpureus TaxID=3225 RepID=A0A8T0J100_CERPU|nr:hypothetical protein KC19_1G004200 [Ceratodon purpureus]